MVLSWRSTSFGIVAEYDGGDFECSDHGDGDWDLLQDGSLLMVGSLQDCLKEASRQFRHHRRATKQADLMRELNRLQNKQILTRKDQQRIFSLLKQVKPEPVK